MTALLLAATSAHALVSLLVFLIVAFVVIAVVYWLFSQILPPPWPNAVAALLGLIVVIWLLFWIADNAG